MTISDKGQLTIPIEMRRRLGLDRRGRVRVELEGDKIIVRRARTAAELAGILHHRAKPGITWEQQREAIERAIGEEAVDIED